MARPRADAHAVATTERVLRAAEQAFSEKGYDGATLAEIARGASIRRPSLLYHFGSKEQLYAEVVQRAFTALGTAMAEAAAAEGDFEERLLEVGRHYSRHLEENPWMARLIVRELLDDQGSGHTILMGSINPLLALTADFVEREGGDLILPDLPVRIALLDYASAELMRVASGRLGQQLWGSDGDIDEKVHRMFMRPRD